MTEKKITFSTFSYETVGLFSDGSYISAMVNIILNVILEKET